MYKIDIYIYNKYLNLLQNNDATCYNIKNLVPFFNKDSIIIFVISLRYLKNMWP